MPDSFFVSQKTQKRKRNTGSGERPRNSSALRKGKSPAGQQHQRARPNATKTKSRGREKGNDSDLTPEEDNDDLEGVDDLDLRAHEIDSNASGSEGDEDDELEAPAEKRLRLAKLYLQSVKEGLAAEEGQVDAAELDKELISSRLKQDVLEHRGKLHKFIADALDVSTESPQLRTRGHRFPVTCSVASADGKSLFSAGKDGCIAKWDLHTGKQVGYIKKRVPESSKGSGKGKGKQKAVDGEEFLGHSDEIWCLAVSDDGRWLVSGGKEKRIGVWDAEKFTPVKSLGGHKDSITGLVFRKATNQLYSASLDRSVKLFDLSPDIMGYVETFFGHQDSALSIDALRNETAVTCGGRDQTCRFWKVVESTQITFRGGGTSKLRDVLDGLVDGMDEDAPAEEGKAKGGDGKGDGGGQKRYVEGSIDCVAMVDENTFVSGGDSGSICVWSTQKKKPVFTQPLAHGLQEMESATEGLIQTPRWITSLATLPYSDVIASGSCSGDIRLWKLEVNAKNNASTSKQKPFSLVLLGSIPAPGIVNSLQILSVPQAASGQFAWTNRSEKRGTQPNGVVTDSVQETQRKADSVLVVAALGQEPRLGRWLQVKGGAANVTKVILLRGKSDAQPHGSAA